MAPAAIKSIIPRKINNLISFIMPIITNITNIIRIGIQTKAHVGNMICGYKFIYLIFANVVSELFNVFFDKMQTIGNA